MKNIIIIFKAEIPWIQDINLIYLDYKKYIYIINFEGDLIKIKKAGILYIISDNKIIY